MSNLPTSPIIAPANPNVEGQGSGMNCGSVDSALGICTDVPNPKESDWDRNVRGATNNPIGSPSNPPAPFQSLVEYEADVFTGSPIGFAPADTNAPPENIYATDVIGTGWDLKNKTAGYTTEVGNWLWGAVDAIPPNPTCKVYAEDAVTQWFDAAPAGHAWGMWICNILAGSATLPDWYGNNDLPKTGSGNGVLQQSFLDDGTIGNLYFGDSVGYRATTPLVGFQPNTLTFGGVVGFQNGNSDTFRVGGAISASFIDIGNIGGNFFITIADSDGGSGPRLIDLGPIPLSTLCHGGNHIAMAYTIRSSGVLNDPWEIDVTAYVDFVLVHPKQTYIQSGAEYWNPARGPEMKIGNTKNARTGYGFAADYEMEYSEITSMGDTFLRNCSSYVDPNPNCIPL
jgi:hypothetical protein